MSNKHQTMSRRLDKIMDALADKTDATWSCYDCDEDGGCYEISTYSPEGENVIITIRGDSLAKLAKDAKEAWDNFDADEHAAEIICAKRSGSKHEREYYAAAPDNLRDLMKDAEAIKAMYKALHDALLDAAGKKAA